MSAFIALIRRAGKPVRVNTKAAVALNACELTSDSVLWKENCSSGNISTLFSTAQKKKKKVSKVSLPLLLEVSQVEFCMRKGFALRMIETNRLFF